MHRLTKRPAIAFVATATAGTLLLTACSGSAGNSATTAAPSTITQSAIDKAMSTKTNLTFWTWVPDIKNEVALFQAKYPAIHVDVVNVGQGAAHYQKLRTAIKAGTGGPDVVQVEFQYLPSFTQGGNLLNMAPYGAAGISGDYASWIWSQVSSGSAVYGIPQDVGPMGNLYRKDLMSAAGIKLPTTWDEFGQAARTYRAANPSKYLTNMPGNDAGQFMGLLWQAGVRPFGYDGKKTVTIKLGTPEVAKVIDFWNPLVRDKIIGVDPDFTDPWYQGLASGLYASWQGAAWGPVFLQGTAGKTSGAVERGTPAAVGHPETGFRQLGWIHRRSAEVDEEPDRRLAARAVDKHPARAGPDVRYQAVPLPCVEHDPEGPGICRREGGVLRRATGQQGFRRHLRDRHTGLRVAAVHGLRVLILQ